MWLLCIIIILITLLGTCVVYWDTRFLQHTFRSTGCDMLVSESRKCCVSCDGYRRYLNSLLYRASGKERVDIDRTNPSSHTPFTSLTSPEKVVQSLYSVVYYNCYLEKFKLQHTRAYG